MLKRKDKLILSYLRNNARQRLTTISRRTHIPVTTIYDNVRKYERQFILKHASLLDFRKLGYKTKAKLVLKAGQDKKALLEYLKESANVNSLFSLSAEYDYLAEVVFEDQEHVDDFLTVLRDKYGVQESLVLKVEDDIKRETFLSAEEL